MKRENTERLEEDHTPKKAQLCAAGEEQGHG